LPKNNREIRFSKRLQILVTDEQYDFIKNELNGGIGFHLRDMIDTHQRFYNKEINNLEKEFNELELNYIAMKKRLDDLRTKQKILDDEQKAKENLIENAKMKLLTVYRRYHNRTDLIPIGIFKTYQEITGIKVEDLKVWLEQQV